MVLDWIGSVVLDWIVLSCSAAYIVLWLCIVLYSIVLRCTMLCCIVLFCVMVNGAELDCWLVVFLHCVVYDIGLDWI